MTQRYLSSFNKKEGVPCCLCDSILFHKFIHYIPLSSLDYQSNSFISLASQPFCVSISCFLNPIQQEAPCGYDTYKHYHFPTSSRYQNSNLGLLKLNPFNHKFGQLTLDSLLNPTRCYTTIRRMCLLSKRWFESLSQHTLKASCLEQSSVNQDNPGVVAVHPKPNSSQR
jgi:hypothetical protein